MNCVQKKAVLAVRACTTVRQVSKSILCGDKIVWKENDAKTVAQLGWVDITPVIHNLMNGTTRVKLLCWWWYSLKGMSVADGAEQDRGL